MFGRHKERENFIRCSAPFYTRSIYFGPEYRKDFFKQNVSIDIGLEMSQNEKSIRLPTKCTARSSFIRRKQHDKL